MIWVGIGQMLECWQQIVGGEPSLSWTHTTLSIGMNNGYDRRDSRERLSPGGAGMLTWSG